MGNKNSGNRTGKARAPGAGRPTKDELERCEVRKGHGVYIRHVSADETTDLGRGRVVIRHATRGGKLLVLPQDDGSEIRILIVP